MSTIKPEGDLCRVDDILAANSIFSTTYSVSDCDWFSTCTRDARHVNPYSGAYVDVVYCEPDSTRIIGTVIVVLAFFIGIAILAAKKKSKSRPADDYYDDYGGYDD